MSSHRHEVQVGLALILSLVILLAGLLWFQGWRLHAENREIKVLFSEVGGLGKDDPVQVRGIPMGKVRSLELVPDGVLVALDLDRRVALTDQAVIGVGTQGLVGERLVTVEPGKGKPLEHPGEQVFQGKYVPAVTEMMGQLEDANQKVMAFLDSANSLLSQLDSGGSLAETVKESSKAAHLAAELLQRNATNFQRATRSLANVGQRLDGFLDQHSDAMGQGIDGLARSTTRLDSVLTQLSQVSAGADSILSAIRQRDGTVGRLIYDREMGENVDASIRQLKWLLDDVRRNPGRYVTVKVF